MTEFAVKCRRPGETKFRFVTPRGGRNSLTVHAARFKDEQTARRTVELNSGTPETAGWEWKVVEL